MTVPKRVLIVHDDWPLGEYQGEGRVMELDIEAAAARRLATMGAKLSWADAPENIKKWVREDVSATLVAALGETE